MFTITTGVLNKKVTKCFVDDYAVARAKTRKAKYTSDLATSSDENITKRRRKQTVLFSSEEESDEQGQLKTPPKLKFNMATHKQPKKGKFN